MRAENLILEGKTEGTLSQRFFCFLWHYLHLSRGGIRLIICCSYANMLNEMGYSFSLARNCLRNIYGRRLEHDAINAHKTERRIFACRSYTLCFRAAFKPEFEQISSVDGKVSCPRIYLLRRRFLLVFP